jgi:hypothetical protein
MTYAHRPYPQIHTYKLYEPIRSSQTPSFNSPQIFRVCIVCMCVLGGGSVCLGGGGAFNQHHRGHHHANKFQVTGLDEVKRQLGSLAKQVPFAASRALNNTAFAVKAGVQAVRCKAFSKVGLLLLPKGHSRWSCRIKTIWLRRLRCVTMRHGVGTPYSKALHHLFKGGARDWKRVEGYLRSVDLIPPGLMVVPGAGCPLDKRGNITRAAWSEVLGVIKSNIKNLRVYRKSGAGKSIKAIGYFVVKPGDNNKLKPGIYKRIQTGATSGIDPMIMFVKRGTWRRFIDIEAVGKAIVLKTFAAEFEKRNCQRDKDGEVDKHCGAEGVVHQGCALPRYSRGFRRRGNAGCEKALVVKCC